MLKAKYKIKNLKVVVAITTFSYFIFMSLVFAIIYYQVIDSSEKNIAKKVVTWEEEISRNVYQGKSKDYVLKILNDLIEHNFVDYFSVNLQDKEFVSSNVNRPSQCYRPLSTDITLSGLPLANLDTCLSKSKIIRASVFSPAFSALSVLGLLLFSLIYIFQRNNKLNLQKAELQLLASEQVKQAMRQFSHDMKNPTATLSMFVDMLENIPKDKKDVILKSTHKIMTISKRLVSGGNVVNLSIPSKKDLSQVMKMAFNQLSSVHKTIKFSLSIPDEPVCANIDSEQMLRIVTNIIENSIESIGDSDGEIIGMLYSSEYQWKLKIIDNGRGISENIISEVFNDGFTYGKENGTGFGLSHAKKYINEWNGFIDLYNNSNEGATVEITLPKYSKD